MQQPESDAPVSLDEIVGRNVHMLMWDRQITQVKLGNAVGIDQSSLAKKLRGKRGWSLDEVNAVAAELGTTIGALCTPWDLNPEPTDYESDAPLAAVVVGPWGSSVAGFGDAA